MITASIVIYHNSINDINKVLDSAIQSSIDKIYIIDHSSNDFLRFLESKSSKLRYISSINKGYGYGNNLAIRIAMEFDNSNYHVVLNPDIYFDNGVIEELASYMDSNSEVGLVMPKVFYPNGELQYLCKLLPTPLDIFSRSFLPMRFYKESDDRFKLLSSGYNVSMNVPYLSGCFMFFRTNALKDVGLFDERYFMHFEDTDISRRIHTKYKTIYYPSVSIIHAHAASHRRSLKMLWIGFSSAIKYFNKWGWFFDNERRLINTQFLKEYK